MAWKTGKAQGHKGLLIALKGFLTNAKMAHNCEADAGNAGTGYVSAERASDSPVDETWTLTATSATNFTVTGSVSGAQAAATVGTPYDNGIVAFTIVAGSTAFEADDSFTFQVANGLGATEKYTLKEWDTNYDAADGYQLMLMGPGTAGADEIYTGINTVKSVSDDYYNWRLAGMTAYSSGVSMGYQPGITQGRLPRLLLWTQQIPYWFVANGRRFIVVAKVSTVYQCLYLGFALPYGLPTQFPYPLVVGGSACPDATVAYNRYSSTHYSHRSFPSPYGYEAAVCTASSFDVVNPYNDHATLKVLQGTSWIKISNKGPTGTYGNTNVVWPYSSHAYITSPDNHFSTLLRENIDGTYPAFPTAVMISSPTKHIIGELQGVFAVPGFGGIAAEDTFVIGGDTYVAFPIDPNAARDEFWALKVE